MKKFSIAAAMISITASVFLTACGGGSSSDTTNNDTATASSSSTAGEPITVVDSYIVNAVVKDNNGKVIGYTDKSGKIYTTVENLAYPLHASGGFIDVNQNGEFDSEDMQVPLDVEFVTDKGDVISPLTTLIANGVDAKKLAELAGVGDPELFYSDPIADNNITLEKANQIAYALIASESVDNFIYNLNISNNSDLPTFSYTDAAVAETGTLEAFANVAVTATSSKPDAQSFINQVVSLDVQSADEIESALIPVKGSVVAPVVESVASSSSSSLSSEVAVAESSVSSEVSSAQSSMSSEVSSVESSVSSIVSSSSSYSSSASSELPNFSDFTNPSASSSSVPSDLPNFGSAYTSESSSSSITSSSSSSSVSTTTSDLPQFSY